MSWFMKRLLSVMISLMTLFVPKEKYQNLLDNHPPLEKRIEKKDLRGWKFNKATSERTSQLYTWFSLKSVKDHAPTIVFLHGFNTDGTIFSKVNKLAEDYNLVAYNFPDKSTFYRGNLSDFNFVIDDFLQTVNLDTIVLVGNSIGGSIALKYTSSERTVVITHLILLSTNIFGTTEENVKQVRGMTDKLLKYPDYKLYYLLLKGHRILEGLEDKKIGENFPSETIDIRHVDWYRQVLKSLYNYNGENDAKKVTCPVIAFHGSADNMLNIEGAEKITEFISNARLIIVEGAGHDLVYVNYDKIFDDITNFLNDS